MRSIALALIFVGTVAASHVHAFTSTGVIEAVNPNSREVRILNGDSYYFPTTVDLSTFRPGQRVHVIWSVQNPSIVNSAGEQYIKRLEAVDIRLAG